jgi:hypothetical protein
MPFQVLLSSFAPDRRKRVSGHHKKIGSLLRVDDLVLERRLLVAAAEEVAQLHRRAHVARDLSNKSSEETRQF